MIDTVEHAWLPRTTCHDGCVGEPADGRLGDTVRIARRIVAAGAVLLALPLLAIPVPGRTATQRLYCRLLLSCLGIRITLSGDPVRNLRGLLVVSNHVSWVDVFAVGAVVPGSFVARADLTDWPGIGRAARMVDVIPIERRSLRLLPSVVYAVSHRLRQGRTVVAFPEGTTYCGEHRGRFRPAVFQAAVETGRPVQPLRVSYWHGDGTPSTLTAFLGEESLWGSLRRIVRTPRTVVQVEVRSLQLPGADRRELAMRCEAALLPG
jgi:1-acyl-sn-glycerol-3-phosphate acyltransferase